MNEQILLRKASDKGYDLFTTYIEHLLDCPGLGVLIDNWPHYDQLKTIVIGSSPARNFSSTGAFVGKPMMTDTLPRSVKFFVDALGEAFGVPEGTPPDLEAVHSKLDHGIMFVNVCLCTNYTDYTYEVKDTYVERVVEFINQVLAMKMENNQKIGVLDLRLDYHCHRSEYQGYSGEDYRRSSTSFKIGFGDAHNIFRLGHPLDFNVHWDRAIEKLRIMASSSWHPEIKSIYHDRIQCPSC